MTDAAQLTLADRFARPLRRFLAIEAASSVLLLAATLVALAFANSPGREAWAHFWHQRVAHRDRRLRARAVARRTG